MIPSHLAMYARALLDIAAQSQQEQVVADDLAVFGELLTSHPELRGTLRNPAIPFSAKREIVEEIGRSVPLNGFLVNLIVLLLEAARIHQFGDVMATYQALLDERRGVVTAEVSSCLELDDGMKGQLQTALSRMIGGQARITYRLDPSLIGGLTLQIGSTIYDGSLRTQLEALRHRLVSQ